MGDINYRSLPARNTKFISYSCASGAVLEPVQLLTETISGTLSREIQWPEREADYSFPSSREGGNIPPIPHTPSWCVEAQDYSTLLAVTPRTSILIGEINFRSFS
jgi:hypothetical protein